MKLVKSDMQQVKADKEKIVAEGSYYGKGHHQTGITKKGITLKASRKS